MQTQTAETPRRRGTRNTPPRVPPLELASTAPRLSRESEAADPIDVHVGHRMRIRRSVLGLTQTNLGDAIGVTFQQIQKYERGSNRLSASRLFDLASVLQVPVSFFYEDLPAEVVNQRGLLNRSGEPDLERVVPSDARQGQSNSELEVQAAVARLTPVQRKRLVAFLNAL